MTSLAARPGLDRPRRAWVLASLYPLVALLLALSIAYPLADLLARSFLVEGDVSARTLARLVGDRHVRQVAWNTVSLGATVA